MPRQRPGPNPELTAHEPVRPKLRDAFDDADDQPDPDDQPSSTDASIVGHVAGGILRGTAGALKGAAELAHDGLDVAQDVIVGIAKAGVGAAGQVAAGANNAWEATGGSQSDGDGDGDGDGDDGDGDGDGDGDDNGGGGSGGGGSGGGGSTMSGALESIPGMPAAMVDGESDVAPVPTVDWSDPHDADLDGLDLDSDLDSGLDADLDLEFGIDL